jgi:hypothetical protein
MLPLCIALLFNLVFVLCRAQHTVNRIKARKMTSFERWNMEPSILISIVSLHAAQGPPF